uniref:Uncharacterized protein n=1 Tax=Candidatus Kentrum sp. LFY TaxID=2126342 RepID=A0A450WDR4_9GAMM|nr:MAG: hypothetical protein BECKLFY1418C_GA0070996_101342 [Candidatus Kentron sp. LFY]
MEQNGPFGKVFGEFFLCMEKESTTIGESWFWQRISDIVVFRTRFHTLDEKIFGNFAFTMHQEVVRSGICQIYCGQLPMKSSTK